MTLGTFAGIAAQLLGAAAIGWVVGDVILRRSFARDARLREDFGAPERVLAAILGFVVFSVVLMLGHLVTGGGVFGVPGVVPAAGAAVIVWGRARFVRPRPIDWRPIVGLGVVLTALYVVPVALGGSGIRSGDAPWHLGWSEQLLGGEAVPVGPAPNGANAYPWGLHAVLAAMARLVPGSNALVALEALHIVALAGIPLAAASLARRVDRRAGLGAAAAVSLVGGWGWLMLEEPDFVFHPDQARYGADLVVASPNAVYALFPPSSPRELALVVLGTAAILTVVALRAADRKLMMVAGAVAGVVGLVNVPMFVSALLWLTAATALARRWRLLVAGIASAAVVMALWAGPVVADMIRFDGLLNVTPRLGFEHPVLSSLGSWGLLLPAAAVGVVFVLRRYAGSPLLAFAGASVVLLALAIARGEFDWGLAGNATLLHQGRAWPPAHLAAAAFAGIAGTWLFIAVSRRSRYLASAAAALLLGVGVISPALASLRFTKVLDRHGIGYVYAADDFAPGSFVREAAAELDPDDVVLVRGPDRLGFFLFEFAGCRLATYDDPRLDGNDLRIRFTELAEEWDAQVAAGGFAADYVVIPAASVVSTDDVVATGSYDGATYALIHTR